MIKPKTVSWLSATVVHFPLNRYIRDGGLFVDDDERMSITTSVLDTGDSNKRVCKPKFRTNLDKAVVQYGYCVNYLVKPLLRS